MVPDRVRSVQPTVAILYPLNIVFARTFVALECLTCQIFLLFSHIVFSPLLGLLEFSSALLVKAVNRSS